MTDALAFPKPLPEPKAPKRLRRSSPPKRTGPPRVGTYADYLAAVKAQPRRRTRVRANRPKALGTHREKVKYANDLWRHLIYAKEPTGLCPRCRQRPWHDAAHLFTKGAYPALRFDTSNGAPLCRVCHRRVDSDHHAKLEFFIPYIGRPEYDRLALRASSRAKTDLGLVIVDLERRSA